MEGNEGEEGEKHGIEVEEKENFELSSSNAPNDGHNQENVICE
jgi:hypothetical protein